MPKALHSNIILEQNALYNYCKSYEPRLTKEQILLLKDDLCTELAGYLVDDYHYTPQEAIDVVYTSETFERLQDDSTGLYYQSPGYVYSFLLNELKTAKVF